MSTDAQAAWIERVLGLQLHGKPGADPTARLNLKPLIAEMAALLGRIVEASGGDRARLDQLKSLAGAANSAIKAGDEAAARDAVAALKQAMQPPKPAARPVLQIWREAKEAVDAGISALQAELLAHRDPTMEDTLKQIAERGLNGVTSRASVGMMVAMMEASTSPAARDKALKAVESFRGFVNGDVARYIDDNPFKVKVGLKATFGAALDQIATQLSA